MAAEQHAPSVEQEFTRLRQAHRRFRFERYRAGWDDTDAAWEAARNAVDELDVSPAAVARFCRETHLDVDDGVFLFHLYRAVGAPDLDL